MLGQHTKRWSQRDWAEWDLEHPYIPKGSDELAHGTNYWAQQPSSWRPNPGQDMSMQQARVPTDKDLENATDKWKGDPSDMRYMQSDIENNVGVEPWNVGGPSLYENHRAQAASIMNQIADGSESTKSLYRGLTLPSSSVDGLKEGQEFKLPMAGFSELKSVATGRYKNPSSDESSVLYKLSPGARTYNLDSDHSSMFDIEREHITAGSFKVVSIKKPDDPSDISVTTNGKFLTKAQPTVITIQQTAPLVKPEGGFR